MTSEFQETSLSPTTTITATAPESLLVKLEDAKEIELIYAIKHPSSESQQGRDAACFVDGETFAEENGTDQPAREESVSNVDDADDGFRTPTSSDHKIPVAKQCPPAPRKQKRILCSRRSSKASGARRCYRFYMSDDIVESIFSSTFRSDLHQKIKKARKDDHGDE